MRTLAVAATVALATMLGGALLVGGKPAPAPAATGSPGDFTPTQPPRPAPELAFVDGDGRKVELRDFLGRVVLVNVWATWCQPCFKEMPSLDRLQGRLGGPDFHVVAVSVDRGGAGTVAPFFRKLGLDRLALYLDPSSAAMRAFKTRGLPTSALIDREGMEIARVEGAIEWDSPETLKVIRAAIARGGPSRGDGMPGGVVKTGG